MTSQEEEQAMRSKLRAAHPYLRRLILENDCLEEDACLCQRCGALSFVPRVIGPNDYWLRCENVVRSCPGCNGTSEHEIDSQIMLYAPVDHIQVTIDLTGDPR